MSRAIFKMRSNNAVAILLTDLGRVNSTPSNNKTFTNVDVGAGANRTIIIATTVETHDTDFGRVDSITVDGIACPRRVQKSQDLSNDSIHAAIFSVLLTTQTGLVDIVLSGNANPDSWGMSAIIVSNLLSPVPTDTAIKSLEGSGSVTTSSTLEGTAGGFVLAVSSFDGRDNQQNWGNLMTERTDLQTGSGATDHRHSVAYDLIPAGRSAATETVTNSGNGKYIIVTAAFR